MSNRLIIIEVEGFEGEAGSIVVTNDRADSDGLGKGDRLYCIAELDVADVARFVDWGYATIAEARAAWPLAISPT
jgi:hypothetical protein